MQLRSDLTARGREMAWRRWVFAETRCAICGCTERTMYAHAVLTVDVGMHVVDTCSSRYCRAKAAA